jgi:hypothetical protein
LESRPSSPIDRSERRAAPAGRQLVIKFNSANLIYYKIFLGDSSVLVAKVKYGSLFCLLSFGLIFELAQVDQDSSSQAKTFFIEAADGYGVEDCLSERGECGNAVANTLCEAFGRGAAIRFGRSEDGSEVTLETLIPERYFVTRDD